MSVVRKLSWSATLAAAAALAVAPARSQAQVKTYVAHLSGGIEVPVNASPGIGFAQITHDITAHTMTVDVVFGGLIGGVTASHIHCCTTNPPPAGLAQTAGVVTTTPTFTGFPGGVTSGTYHQVFDMLASSSYNTAPTAFFNTVGGGSAAATETAFFQGIDEGRAYLNIHTTFRPGGEIRGFLVATPEPSTYVLMVTGLAALGVVARRRRAA